MITKTSRAGNDIIVAGDFNDNLNNENGPIRKMMERLHLREVLLELNCPGPNKHNRGRDDRAPPMLRKAT